MDINKITNASIFKQNAEHLINEFKTINKELTREEIAKILEKLVEEFYSALIR